MKLKKAPEKKNRYKSRLNIRLAYKSKYQWGNQRLTNIVYGYDHIDFHSKALAFHIYNSQAYFS